MPDKPALRDLLKARLKAHPPESRAAASSAIAQGVLSLPEYARARVVMLYVSMPSEVNTAAIAEDVWASGRRVLVPVAKMADRSMHAVEIRSLAEADRKTAIGVLEPEAGEAVDPAEIDLVLVPGLGFGPAGERIGRGAGFYDRFLANPRLRARKCGIAFELQVIDGIPMTDRDMPLEMLVTEAAVRRFRQF